MDYITIKLISKIKIRTVSVPKYVIEMGHDMIMTLNEEEVPIKINSKNLIWNINEDSYQIFI